MRKCHASDTIQSVTLLAGKQLLVWLYFEFGRATGEKSVQKYGSASSGQESMSNSKKRENSIAAARRMFRDKQLKMPQLDAVIIRNLTYEAGRGSGKRVILNKINLTVPEGSM